MRCNRRAARGVLFAHWINVQRCNQELSGFELRFWMRTLRLSSANPDTTPRDCDNVNYSGYCHESKVAPVRNTMRVQSGNGKPFDITCVWDSRLSRCVALPIGQTFDARKDKHGITIFYENEKGGASKQLYTVVEAVPTASPTTSADAGPKSASQNSPSQNSTVQATTRSDSGVCERSSKSTKS